MHISRRGLAAAGVGALTPSLAWAQAPPFPIAAWHDRTSANHGQELNARSAQGFRTISLCVYGAVSALRYAAVMAQFPTPPAQRQFFDLTAAQAQARFNEQAGQGYGPIIITATGPVNDPRFAMVFAPMNPIPLTRLSLTPAEFEAHNVQAMRDRAMLRWADAFGSASDPRYCAIWTPNSALDGWNALVSNASPADNQAAFNAHTAGGARPYHLAVTPGGNYIEAFTDARIDNWVARGEMTSASYQAEFNTQMAQGRVPIRVAAKGEGASTKFAAIFARRADFAPRQFRMTGPVQDAQIDGVIEQMMRAHGMRGVSLAITRGSRLVYARGYTWAEPAPTYPTIQPTTRFRQASVSKTFVAVALMRQIQQGVTVPGTRTPVTLDTTMQSVLSLTKPDGSQPADAKFSQITLRHLLTSTSGLFQSLIWYLLEAVQAAGAQLPCTPSQLARFVASSTFTKTPGDPTNVVYGNLDYFMLSQVVARLANASSFESALASLVVNPLQMTRTGTSRSLLSDQPADEAPYHRHVHDPRPQTNLYPLEIGQSARSGDRPLRAYQYGMVDYEILDGCGGLSCAIVDLARLVAMLSAPGQNPVLSAASITALLQNTVAAWSNLSGPDDHGHYGFDWGVDMDAANGVYRVAKGGYIPGHESYFEVDTGGFGYFIAANCNKYEVGFQDWLPAVRAVTEAKPWGDGDLFPQYQMPSFGGTVIAGIGRRLPIRAIPRNGLEMTRASVTASLSQRPRTIVLRPIPRPPPGPDPGPRRN